MLPMILLFAPIPIIATLKILDILVISKYLFPNKKFYNWITEIRINKRIANRAS